MWALYESITLAIPIVHFGKAVDVFGLHEEARVTHRQRREDILFEEVAEAHAAESLDDVALYVYRNRIRPALTGFEEQGYL